MGSLVDRRDVGYTIMSRFEQHFRAFLAQRLRQLFARFSDGIPAGIVDKAHDRGWDSDHGNIDDLLENVDFSDLVSIVCFNNMYGKYFPAAGLERDEFEDLMGDLYSRRCKIAHVRGTFTSIDLDCVVDATKKIAAQLGGDGQEFLEVVRSLEENPELYVLRVPPSFSCSELEDLVPNNVPTPDYEFEGGFVGREDDLKKVTALLKGHLHRVITISGAGGVGKTALALRVIQRLMRRTERVFDGIVWLSAKETRLSYLGIEDTEPTVKNYEQLLDVIYEVMGFGVPPTSLEEKERDVQVIFDLHPRVLIVIDNLETVTDERVIDFIMDSHPHAKILITSRKGLGQVERRHELKQLKEKDAIVLFRFIAIDKHLDGLAKLDDPTIATYVRKVACYPLAIKWVLGNVAVGKDIHSVIDSIDDTTSDVSRFCFEQIFGGLSESSKRIICAISCFDDPPSAGVLKYVVDLSQRSFEDGIGELVLISLVNPEQQKNSQGEVSSGYSLLSLTRGYVRRQLDGRPDLKREIETRLQKAANMIEEADRAKSQYRFSLANLGATTEEEKVAQVLANTAFQTYQAGRYAEAVEDYRRASEIAPRFASVYRNWAVVESQEGHTVEAERLMEKAAKLSPNETQVWLTWGNMRRRGERVKDALVCYQKAYLLSPNDPIVLNALGLTKSRLGLYAEADGFLRAATQADSAGSSRRNEIINLCSIADNLRRWAESDARDHDDQVAATRLEEAYLLCERAVVLDMSDNRSLELRQEVCLAIGYLRRRHSAESALPWFIKAIQPNPFRYVAARRSVEAAVQAAQLQLALGHLDEARSILSTSVMKAAGRLRPEHLKNDPRSLLLQIQSRG